MMAENNHELIQFYATLKGLPLLLQIYNECLLSFVFWVCSVFDSLCQTSADTRLY